MGGIHDKHRKRLRESYAKDGPGSLTPERLLELLLFTPIPRADTYATAKALIKRFGGLKEVFEANINDLQEVENVGFSTAIYIKAIYDLNRNYLKPKEDIPKGFSNEKDLERFVISLFEGARVEKVAIICLSKDFKLLHHGIIQEGTISSASFKMRRVTEIAINTNASYVVVAHNHPAGSALPSDTDIDATRMMASSLSSNGIELREHYIVYKNNITPLMKILGLNLHE